MLLYVYGAIATAVCYGGRSSITPFLLLSFPLSKQSFCENTHFSTRLPLRIIENKGLACTWKIFKNSKVLSI